MTLTATFLRAIRAIAGFISESACGIIGDAVAGPPPPPARVWGKIAALCAAFCLAALTAESALAQSCSDGQLNFRNASGDLACQAAAQIFQTCQSDNNKVYFIDPDTGIAQCVTPQEKCEMTAGWNVRNDERCRSFVLGMVGYYKSSWREFFTCYFSETPSENEIPCATVFGANMEFPPALTSSNRVFNCDTDGTRGLIPANANTTGAEECQCADPNNTQIGRQVLFEVAGVTSYIPGHCYPEFGSLEDFSDAELSELCAYHGGSVSGGICAGVDAAQTFCVLDGPDLDCRGLLRHVRNCNENFGRLALNPFLCGRECADGEVARGGACQ